MALADGLGDALWAGCKFTYREAKARERSYYTGRPYRAPREERLTIKDAVFEVLRAGDAIRHATGDGRYTMPQRSLMYQVRPRIQQLGCDDHLSDKNFAKILQQFQDIHGPIRGLTYEPRGHLIEPHTGKKVPLGTVAVASYIFPEHVYNKILYVEKVGLDSMLIGSGLANRYDMAIASGQGYSVEACRTLLDRAQAGKYRIFALHDADPDGYDICRTLGEATARMPDHDVEVIDLGLTVAEAQARDLEPEKYQRVHAPSSELLRRLTPQEEEWFGQPPVRMESRGVRKLVWRGLRVEINALTGPETVDYIEEKLAEHEADDKLIPPSEAARKHAEKSHETAVRGRVDEWLAQRFDAGEMADTIVGETKPPVVDEQDIDQWVVDGIDEKREAYWRDTVKDKVDGLLDERKDEINARVMQLVNEQLAAEDDEDDEDEAT